MTLLITTAALFLICFVGDLATGTSPITKEGR